jgi:outer membrane lipoprotein SlyB
MLNRNLVLVAAAGLAAAACATDPYYGASYSEPRYVASGPSSYVGEGRVVAIDVVRRGGGTSGAGAVIGGIVGGVVGHQFGSGRGNDAATVAGAVGGAVAGNEIERRRDADEAYRIVVQTRDGREATFVQDSLNGLRVGDFVRIDGNRLYRG